MDLKSNIVNNYKKILVVLAMLAFFLYATHYINKKPSSTEISVGSSTIYAQIADEKNKWALGLSFTKSITDNAGMIFIFDDVGEKNFWMKDMYFDLDIIWLDENKQVVGFYQKVPASGYNSHNPELSKIYHSPENTKYVLEVNSGTIEKLKIKVGDTLNFKY